MNEMSPKPQNLITQYQGDMILVSFNAITPDEQHAGHAIGAALALQDELNNRDFAGIRLQARCGINTGPMAIGAMGAQNRLVFTVLGDDVNIAARLEALNKDYDTYILIGQNTASQCGGAYALQHLDDVQVRGRSGKTAVYTVDDTASPRSGSS